MSAVLPSLLELSNLSLLRFVFLVFFPRLFFYIFQCFVLLCSPVVTQYCQCLSSVFSHSCCLSIPFLRSIAFCNYTPWFNHFFVRSSVAVTSQSLIPGVLLIIKCSPPFSSAFFICIWISNHTKRYTKITCGGSLKPLSLYHFYSVSLSLPSNKHFKV